MIINKKLLILIFFFSTFINYSFEHGLHSAGDSNNKYQKYLEKFIINNIKHLSKLNQATIGAAIISSAPIPIFFLIVAFKIKDITILDVMSSFAAGALIGDVFIHNLPEIQRSYQHNSLYICWGILSLFMLEKIISYYEEKNKKLNVNGKQTNIIISLVGDFMHNFTDGMAIGAGFNKNLKLGVSLSLSIFFHEIPHEVGDFSYLLKQNMNITNAVISQLITALGSFLGVYVSFEFGEMYSDRIISFASGAFLYLAINTIMGDLKRSRSLLHISYQAIAFIFGVCILDALL